MVVRTMHLPTTDVLFDGFLGALLGGLVSVFVAFWIVRRTKSADIEVARVQAGLIAAEQVQQQLLTLMEAAIALARLAML